MTLHHRILLATLFAIAFAASGAAKAADTWVTKESPHPVPVTVDKLTNAIQGAGATVALVLDHSANAAKAGLDLPPTTLVVFGNPKLGTPLMSENRLIAIDLPQKILVWQDGGATMIGYVAPRVLADRYGVAQDHQSIQTMQKALDNLTNAAVAE